MCSLFKQTCNSRRKQNTCCFIFGSLCSTWRSNTAINFWNIFQWMYLMNSHLEQSLRDERSLVLLITIQNTLVYIWVNSQKLSKCQQSDTNYLLKQYSPKLSITLILIREKKSKSCINFLIRSSPKQNKNEPTLNRQQKCVSSSFNKKWKERPLSINIYKGLNLLRSM